ncbi:uncharacterized protein Tco025E_03612 [Trypanosoma conorhini]|uniref:Nicastrin n=1 Tax=Trypanosoma conorhini TaxID=83891 RepID=A0A422PTT3_9TRYP|nr:uncharacterized protein Tco025E_03612 [Trypanosoma conorhini]RNF20907.1 hypothetical protein Tco025E_03612 [Trypanosoma conorhini]
MHHRLSERRAPVAVFCIAAWLALCGAAAQRGFSGDIPAAPHDAVYRAHFRNYPAARPCVLTAAFATVEGDGASNASAAAYGGCDIAGSAVVPHSLLLLHVTEVAQASVEACGGNATPLQEILRGLAPMDALSASGVGLVLSTRIGSSSSSNKTDKNSKNGPAAGTTYDMTCFLVAVQRYNALAKRRTRGPTPLPPVSAVAFSDDGRVCRFSGGRRGGEELLLPREVRSVYDFVLLYFPTAAGRGDGDGGWTALMDTAEFNRLRWSEGHFYPQSVLETRNGMALAESSASPARARSCFEGPALPSCAPLGGWTVWTSTADMRWGWDAASMDFEKKTRKGAVALLVASTAVSLVQGATPGADCPASAVVATLAVLEALRRVGGGANRDVYAFFFPGEHVGSVGSARFISDATRLECARAGLSSCTALAYKDNLNFTTVDFGAMDTFLVLDQVAYHDAPLYYHVDGRVGEGSARQQQAEAELKRRGVRRASTARLPYSPITTLLDLLPAAAAGEKVLLTLTRYNTTYANPDVFTVLDTTARHSALRAAAVAEAADVILRLLLPHTHRAAAPPSFSSWPPPAVSVNHSLVEELWGCFTENLHCGLLTTSDGAVAASAAPDFGVGVMRGGGIADSQAAIEAALLSIGWNDVARSPAVPKPLRIPHGDWAETWEQDRAWARQHNDSRYALHVMSLWSEDVGARSTMVESEAVALAFFGLSVLVAVAVLLGANVCVKP